MPRIKKSTRTLFGYVSNTQLQLTGISGVEITQAMSGMPGLAGAEAVSWPHTGNQSSYCSTGDLTNCLSSSLAKISICDCILENRPFCHISNFEKY